MQTSIDFYRDAGTPLNGTTGNNWLYPGNALSASSRRIYPSTRKLFSAQWVLVWNPNAGDSYNACRLITADDGPSNEAQIAFLSFKDKLAPVVQGYDVKNALNAILSGTSSKQVLFQTSGQTQSKIYSSHIDLVWED